jgi:hypothetical protein
LGVYGGETLAIALANDAEMHLPTHVKEGDWWAEVGLDLNTGEFVVQFVDEIHEVQEEAN